MKFGAITATQVAPWYETPAAVAAIAAIDIDELFLSRPIVVMGDNLLHFSGDPVETLRDVRRTFVDDLFGATFREAEKVGRAHDYLDLEATVPSVDAGLAAYFGEPRGLDSDPRKATLQMRFLVRQKVAKAARAA